VYDWPIGVDAKDDPKGLAMSVKRVENIVTQLNEDEGIDPSRVVLGGFSQGGAVAIMAAYNRRKKDSIPFAGCICMSGWLPMKDYLDISEEAAKATPLFWAHGQYDDKILFEQQIYGVNKLEGVGVDVTSYSYPVGHESSNFEEIEDMAIFLESVLCPQSKTGKIPKFAQVDPDLSGSASNIEDETNTLLYYLCAIGIADNDEATSASKSILTVDTMV
jgi:lysophospholipase-2